MILGLSLSSVARGQELPGITLPDRHQQIPLSKDQKFVDRTTDIVALALPTAALVGTLCARDWKGLVQGVEVAAATAGATLILKYGVKEWRPDFSDTHSFPSAHTAVSFASAAYLQRRYGWAFGGPAYALSCYVAWGRVFSKQHAYRSDKAKTLRLYYRLDTRRGLEKNIEELNTFENINIEIKGDTLVVD